MTYDDMESRLKGGGPPMQAATVQGGWRGMKDVTAPPSGPASTKPAAGSKSSLQQSLMHTIDCCSWHGLGQVSKAHVKGDRQVEGKIRLHDVVTPLKLPVVPAQRNRDWFHDALFAFAKGFPATDTEISIILCSFFALRSRSIGRWMGGQPL